MTPVTHPNRNVGMITVPLIILALLLLVFAIPGTPPDNPPPTPCPNTMTPEQETDIRDFAQKLGPGGEFEGYPLLADRATRTAFLAARGITGMDAVFNFQIKAGTLRQTARELLRGECWNVSDQQILEILRYFVELARQGNF